MKQDIRTIPAAVAAAFAEHLEAGMMYAGVLLGIGDEPAQHIFLLPDSASDIKWDDAKVWAESIGGELPKRREQALLYANLKAEFEATWYWSGEQLEAYPDYAWYQDFTDGYQSNDRKSYAGRARAVRRFPI